MAEARCSPGLRPGSEGPGNVRGLPALLVGVRLIGRTLLAVALIATCLAAPSAGASPVPAMSELWLMSADGTEEERFSDLSGYGLSIDWSPDGQRVVFTRHGYVTVADADGSNQVVISGEGGHDPHWSPDGQWIAYGSWGGAEGTAGLRITSPDGTSNRLLLPGEPPNGVAWSPDSSRLSYLDGEEGTPASLFVVDIETGNSILLIEDAALYTATDWSFDGQWISFLAWDQGGVRTIRSDGSESHRVFEEGEWHSAPEWSPTENVLAFSSEGEIVVSDPRGEEVSVLTTGSYPTWSPDGQKLAFARSDDIWTLDLTTGLEERLTEERLQNDTEPTWSPDGSTISFVRTRVQVYCSYGEYGVEANIIGTADSEVLEGTEGRDIIAGMGGNDEIHGLGEDDIICGGPGADVIHGGDGQDHLTGDSGKDLVSGDAGDDNLLASGGNDTINGSLGSDTVSYEGAPRSVVVDLARRAGRGWGIDAFVSIENVAGGYYDDTIRGDSGRNLLRGDSRWATGDDTIIGRGGPDVLWGDGGSDYLDGGRGRDELDGGRGKDRCRRGETLASC